MLASKSMGKEEEDEEEEEKEEEEERESEEELRPIIVSCLRQYPMCAHSLSLFAIIRPWLPSRANPSIITFQVFGHFRPYFAAARFWHLENQSLLVDTTDQLLSSFLTTCVGHPKVSLTPDEHLKSKLSPRLLEPNKYKRSCIYLLSPPSAPMSIRPNAQ